MNFVKWASKTFLTINEAVDYLSAKSGESQDLMNLNRITRADVLSFAVNGSLPLVVDVQTGTEDVEGRPIEAGLWDLPLEGAGRQQVEDDWRISAGLSRIDQFRAGAVVERDGVRRQLKPIVNPPSAIGVGCVMGARREALDALLAEKVPPADALDKNLPREEREKLLSIIYGLVTSHNRTRRVSVPEIDLSKPWNAAEQIESMTLKAGMKVSAKTIDRRLKEMLKMIEIRGTTETPPFGARNLSFILTGTLFDCFSI